MKKIIALLSLIALVFSLVACELPLDFLNPEIPEGSGSDLPENPENPETPEDPEEPEEPAGPVCEHEFVEIGRTEAKPLSDGVIISKCGLCNEEKTDVHTPMTKTLKLLAIGNSFSNDALGYLWDICHDAGVEKLIIGHAYVGGCSLNMHASYLLYKQPAYEYHKYERSSKYSKEVGVRLDYILEDEEWDYISLQQLSEYTTRDQFSLLDLFVENIKKKSPSAELYWHMTWSFSWNCNEYKGFELHDRDQMKLYNALVGVVTDIIEPRDDFQGIIPAGTAMQNIRTSYIGDNVNRPDGYHADLGIGRYTIGLTWYAIFTGGSLDRVDFVPNNEYKTAIANNMEVMRESVENALAKPLEITQSQYTVAPSAQ